MLPAYPVDEQLKVREARALWVQGRTTSDKQAGFELSPVWCFLWDAVHLPADTPTQPLTWEKHVCVHTAEFVVPIDQP